MKKPLFFLLTALTSILTISAAPNTYTLLSPDAGLRMEITVNDSVTYSVFSHDKLILSDNRLSLTLRDEVLGEKAVVTKTRRTEINEEITPVVAIKFRSVTNHCNQLSLTFRGGWGIDFRAYDDGIATRFVLNRKGTLDVMGETFGINLPTTASLTKQEPRGFGTSYEDKYTIETSEEWGPKGNIATLPFFIDTKVDGIKLLVSESDLDDYPCLFVRGAGKNRLTSDFPREPLEYGDGGDRHLKIVSENDYMARISAKRTLPWRYIVVARNDGQLVTSAMTLRLASPCELEGDLSWIKPGQVSWEWWNGAIPYGPDVNFVSGCNLDTYKYFIDFAAKYGIPYILMDEGWAKSTRDPYTPNPDVDLQELIRYGNEKGVGIFLWLTWLVTEQNPDLFETFEKWGIKGVKVDFMDRSDQWMVNFYERNAKLAADHHLMIAYHGAFKPAGLEYRYPNLLAYEGVRGMEQNGSCIPENSLWFPFMRNAVGPMDYTPGAMISHQPECYAARRPDNASIGTRAYQLALFVLFETGFQMLADNPTLYYRNDDCTRFITSVPVIWDDSRVLAAEAGKYIVEAKQRDGKWFIGAITGPDPQEGRDIDLKIDFLGSGAKYTMTLFEDGPNSHRQAMDYRTRTIEVRNGDVIKIHMARNGGFAARID